MNKIKGKGNKESTWAILCIVLAITICAYSLTWMEQISLDGDSIKKFDFYMFWYLNWWRASIDIFYAIPTMLIIFLVILSIYFSIKSTARRTKKARGLLLVCINRYLKLGEK